ncbi:MAG: HAD family hydrolase [Theionarchaea archaeon]|nr:HAD family hydrolase [Theionarchaea archaeon]
MHDTFLFDVDGTLVSMELDFVQIRKEVDALLVSRGFPEEQLIKTASILETITSAVEYMRVKGLGWKQMKEEADSYLERVELEAASKAVLIKGADTVLKLLKKHNKKIGVITRNNRRVVLNILEKSGLSTYVDTVLARDDVEKVKPHPDHVLQALGNLNSSPEKTVVIGDHHFEIEAGNTAGCFTIGLLTGSGTKDTLKDADMVLDSINDLKEIIMEL